MSAGRRKVEIVSPRQNDVFYRIERATEIITSWRNITRLKYTEETYENEILGFARNDFRENTATASFINVRRIHYVTNSLCFDSYSIQWRTQDCFTPPTLQISKIIKEQQLKISIMHYNNIRSSSAEERERIIINIQSIQTDWEKRLTKIHPSHNIMMYYLRNLKL